jgi:hypothetical protein
MTDHSDTMLPPPILAPVAYKRSESLVHLAPALAKAMGAMGAAAKDSTNPHFKSKYADLASCHGAAVGPLTDNGLSFPMFPMVEPASEGVVVTITALLLHESGEYFEGSITIPTKDAHAQAIGSAMTYGRRYLYCMVGIVADDDDGNAAVGRQAPPEKRREPPPAPKAKETPKASERPAEAAPEDDMRPHPEAKATDDQTKRTKELLKAHGFGPGERNAGMQGAFAKHVTGRMPADLTVADADLLIATLRDAGLRGDALEAIGGHP